MTKTAFLELCLKYNLSPDLALEHDGIINALKEKNAVECERIMLEEF